MRFYWKPLVAVGVVAFLLGSPARAVAQGGSAGTLETEPVKCWWRTSTPAVLVGERFTVVLTCGVVETRTLTAVADTSQLEPTTIQVTPFEVVEGVRNQDVVAPPWRYFQYEYTLRLVGDASFGQDIQIPSVRLSYSIRGSAGAGSEGRELAYAMPPLPMRVLSVVNKTATDIRDGQPETFKAIEDRLFRSTSEFVAACIFFGFAAALAIAGLARLVAQRRRRAPVVARPPSARNVLYGCFRAVRGVRADVSGAGWTPETISRALAACRLAAAVGLGRPFGYLTGYMGDPVRAGQVVLPHRPWRSTRLFASAPTVPGRIERAIGPGEGRLGIGGSALSTLAEALRTLEKARYQRRGEIDGAALDSALEVASGAIRQLWIASLMPAPLFGARGRMGNRLANAASAS